MSAFPMARIQYVILQFCADIRTASVRELHESFVCQNRDRAVKQRGVGTRSGRPRQLLDLTRIPQSKGKQRARRKFSVAKAMGLYLLESCKRRCDEWLPEMLRTECRVRKMALEHYASVPSQLQTYASPTAGVPLTAESGFN